MKTSGVGTVIASILGSGNLIKAATTTAIHNKQRRHQLWIKKGTVRHAVISVTLSALGEVISS